MFVTEQEIDSLPKILYKYRTWTKTEHKRLLTNCEIYFSAPSELDENTECALPRDYDSVSEKMILQFCLNKAFEFYRTGNIMFDDLINQTRELYAANTFHDIELREGKEIINKNRINEVLSIFCATETSNNERLWNTFARDKTGYCVGIDFTEIYSNQNVFGSCGKVNYYDEENPPKVPAISLDDSDGAVKMMKIIYSLPKKFEKENEFRLSKSYMQNKTVQLKPEWIKEIILGSEISDKDRNEIISIAKTKYPHAKLKRLFVEPTYNILSIVEL